MILRRVCLLSSCIIFFYLLPSGFEEVCTYQVTKHAECHFLANLFTHGDDGHTKHGQTLMGVIIEAGVGCRSRCSIVSLLSCLVIDLHALLLGLALSSCRLAACAWGMTARSAGSTGGSAASGRSTARVLLVVVMVVIL